MSSRSIHTTIVLSLLLGGCASFKGMFRDTTSRNDEPIPEATAPDQATPIEALSPIEAQPVTVEPTPTPAPTPAPLTMPAGKPVTADVLRLNEHVITVEDILEPLADRLAKAAAEMPPQDYVEWAQQRIRGEIQDQVFHYLAYAQASPRLPEEFITVVDRKADEIVRDRINRYYGGSQSAFEAYLETFGKTIEDVRVRERRAIVAQQYAQEQVSPRVLVSRRDLLRYWQQHRAEFETPTKVQMAMIDVPAWAHLPGVRPDVRLAAGRQLWSAADEPTRDQAMQAARRHIADAMAQLRAGVDFAEVAKQYSRGIHAAQGGMWDPVSVGGMQGRWAPINDALATLQPGQFSDVIDGEDGLFIVKVVQRTEGTTTTFEKAQPQIEKRLAKEQADKLIAEMMGRLQASAAMSPLQQQYAFLMAVFEAAPQPRTNP